jgi:hypothetical protein
MTTVAKLHHQFTISNIYGMKILLITIPKRMEPRNIM